MEMHDRGTAATNEQIKEHHFSEGPEHPLKGVVLSRALKRIYSYANCNMSSAEQAVFGQLMMAHEAEIYRHAHEPRHALANVTREARLPVHKVALYVYEHMLAMDDLGDTIKNVTQTQGCVKRHADHIFDILKHRGLIELASLPDRDALGRFQRSKSSSAEAQSQSIRLTQKGRAICAEVMEANERQKDDRWHRRKEIQRENAKATNRRRRGKGTSKQPSTLQQI